MSWETILRLLGSFIKHHQYMSSSALIRKPTGTWLILPVLGLSWTILSQLVLFLPRCLVRARSNRKGSKISRETQTVEVLAFPAFPVGVKLGANYPRTADSEG